MPKVTALPDEPAFVKLSRGVDSPAGQVVEYVDALRTAALSCLAEREELRKDAERAEGDARRRLDALKLLRKLPAPVEPPSKVPHDRPIWNQWQATIDVCQREIDAANSAEVQQAYAPTDETLPADVVAMCKKRGWSMHWTHRGAYLHLESSELIEAIRGKHGDPALEAADVLLVLMSITEYAGIGWKTVVNNARKKCDELMVRPHYAGEEFAAALDAHKGTGL